MVGLVLVSHSMELAQHTKALALQMVQGDVLLAAVGGIDDPDNPFGTDALAIHAAIESVYSDEGVLVLMDLGSAILSAEMAIEFLSPEQQARVQLSAAPLVEGAVAAGVAASIGGTLEQVRTEAEAALRAKQTHLSLPAETETPALASEPPAALQAELPITNAMGLHARPAARLVKLTASFEAAVTLRLGGKQADARSLTQVATLAARQGDVLQVILSGPEAAAALTALQALAADNFGDPAKQPDIAASETVISAEGEDLTGIPAAPGFAIGPAWRFETSMPDVADDRVADVAAEWERLQAALKATQNDLAALRAETAARVGSTEAAIFEAQSLFLEDPDILAGVETLIHTEQYNAAFAWQTATAEIAAGFAALDDAGFQARALDVLDVGRQVLRRLLVWTAPLIVPPEPVILLAADLTPSDTVRLDAGKVLGLLLEDGGPTSHSAILARALGIPAVVGLGSAVRRIAEGEILVLNGETGQVWRQPDVDQAADLQAQQAAYQRRRAALRQAAREPAVTRDGRRVMVEANIGGPSEVDPALASGAEGIGLFRTEFLFLDRDHAPDELEQAAAYRQAAQALGDRPLTLRSLDIGGDKPLPYLSIPVEANPFLGQRGIRFLLTRPELFQTQLRAVLRVSLEYPLKLMLPMITKLDEVQAAKGALIQAQSALQNEGLLAEPQLALGVMIETPAAALLAPQLAAEVDFFSIGSNDLAQYTLAADRGNRDIAPLADPLHPAVLRLMKQTIEAGHRAGIHVSLCGELAGNALATPLLIGLGFDALSMSAAVIPAVKAALRQCSQAEVTQVANAALQLDSAAAVRDYLQQISA